MAITYKKSPTGEWLVQGPAAILRPGATVTVTKADGRTNKELITAIGKTFEIQGVPYVYGYMKPSQTNAKKPKVT